MDAIRPETEIDRTQAAVAATGLALPLARGTIEIAVAREASASPVGQRLLVVLVGELARMKGVVARIHVVGAANEPILPGTPLRGTDLDDGLCALVDGLNVAGSPLRAALAVETARKPAMRLRIGNAGGSGLPVAADGWRALLGTNAAFADWQAPTPYGAGMAAAVAAAESYKQLLAANGATDPARRLVTDLAYSTFNYGLGADAAQGPALTRLPIEDLAIAGCGAGGSAALYVLAMQPGLSGDVALIEPGHHKLSNLNRYLMTTASDVHERRHKLASAINHLATFAPGLRPITYARPWQQLDAHPWELILSTVDTVEARWAIQERCRPRASILDGAVLGLLYSVFRVAAGGWCLECKHPYNPDLALEQRAARWGQTVETILAWTAADRAVDAQMIADLARTQNRAPEDFAELEGLPFSETPRLTECGATALQIDVPSQAPVLPLATTPVGVLLAAEIAKHHAAPDARLANWLAHDLGRSPARPRARWRPAVATCPRHGT
jgi:molybdopterin/thiamine biosynthesis adenylyltransferase